MFKKILIGILLIVLGFAIGWVTQFKQNGVKDRDYFLGKELAQAQFCALSLKHLNEQNIDLLEAELWHKIELSLDRAQRVIKFGATLPDPARSIILQRISEQAKIGGHDELVAQASVIKDTLKSFD